MGEYKTPGVYIREKNAFGNSVVEAETAIPAFIGITEKALNGTESLLNKPWKISSMTDFFNYFGGEPKLDLTVDIKKFHYLSTQQAKDGKKLPDGDGEPNALGRYIVRPANEAENVTLKDSNDNGIEELTHVGYALCVNGNQPYSLYYQMVMFFANGGGTCYIVSVGTYDDQKVIDDEMVGNALDMLRLEREVTMIVVPEAVEGNQWSNIQQLMMKHCGEMANRFAILDVPQGNKQDPLDKRMEDFQNTVTGYFAYGAAYYPWLNTSVLSEKDISGSSITYSSHFITLAGKFDSIDKTFLPVVKALMTGKEEVKKGDTADLSAFDQTKNSVAYADLTKTINEFPLLSSEIEDKGKESEKIIISGMPKDPKDFSKEDLSVMHSALFNGSTLYKSVMKDALKSLNCLPPSAAMAGIYTMVDNTRGVWKAPANVALNYVDSVTENIGDEEQKNLNAPVTGKSINVIRAFRGEGNKVWGARTLDGNSLDWRYINVRRTLLFLEESVRNAARAYVFEPNDASTWINMKCMIENFLRSVWKRGGLAGATPEDAFEVHVGLGDTMTAEDILEGVMRITVLVAVTHPAEFIEITFQQQMQKS